LKETIKTLRNRSFHQIRLKITPIIKELNEKQGRSIPENMCSKHWWFEFIKRHEDIKELWEKLPIERSSTKSKLSETSSPETRHVKSPQTLSDFQNADETPIKLSQNLLENYPIFGGTLYNRLAELTNEQLNALSLSYQFEIEKTKNIIDTYTQIFASYR